MPQKKPDAVFLLVPVPRPNMEGQKEKYQSAAIQPLKLLMESANLLPEGLLKSNAKNLESVMSGQGCSGIYCVGSGKSKKLQSFIEEIRTLANPGAELGLGEIPYKPGQVMHLEADITKLSQETGFFPKTPFHEGIRQTIEWIKQHPAVLSGFGS